MTLTRQQKNKKYIFPLANIIFHGAMTLSITTHSITTLSTTTFIIKGLYVTLSTTTFSIKGLYVTLLLGLVSYFYLLLCSVILLNVVVLSLIMLSVVMPNVAMLSVIMLCVMPNVVMPSVMAPNFTTFITTLTQQLFHKIDLIDWSKNFW
jgi:hypothetical protein